MVSQIIQEKQAYLADYKKYIDALKQRSWEIHKDKMSELVTMRGIPMETLIEHDVFYIGEYAEMLVPEFIDKLESFGVINQLNKQPIAHQRWIIPIKDFDANYINIVGYTPYSDNRYLYGNGRYYDRKNDMFGMENYRYAYELGWGVYVEGITDTMALRSLGIKNAFGSCGTMRSDIKMRHLNQFKYGTIFIRDRDKAGDNTAKHWKTNSCVYMSISIELRLKDIDDYINKAYDPESGSKNVLGPFSETRLERAENLKDTIDVAKTWLENQGPHSVVLSPDIKYADITLT